MCLFLPVGIAEGQTHPPGAPTAAALFSPVALGPVVQRQLRSEESIARFQDPSAPVGAKKKDGLWNGVLIGAGVGAVTGGLLGMAGNDDCEPEVVLVCAAAAGYGVIFGVAFGAGVGAGVGALVDKIR
jgi:hypothetical protein